MHPSTGASTGFEPDASLTGTFEVTLTRALVPFGSGFDRSPPGGRIQDIGLGVVVDGKNPARSDVLDLGSAELRIVDLTGPIVVLGWLYPSGLRSLQRAIEDSEIENRDRIRAFTFAMAVKALKNAGYGSLTRPTILRIGFRDLCKDLDLHEDTALRLLLPSGGVVRLHLEYDTVTLVARTGRSAPDPDLESALTDAFPSQELLRGTVPDPVGARSYQMPLPVPRTLLETRALLARIRRGFSHLLARFEPDRYRALRDLSGALGERDSLKSLEDPMDAGGWERIDEGRRVAAGAREIH